jgi:uncharacterized protein (DUF2164 family)
MDDQHPIHPMSIQLSDERKQAVLQSCIKMFAEKFDEELSMFRARTLLEFFMKALGPPLYNQAVSDARSFMAKKLEDLDVEFYKPEDPL